jgi:hypothetical protein
MAPSDALYTTPSGEPGRPRPASLNNSRAERARLLFPFDNTYARLPERFYVRLDPPPVSGPRLVIVNSELAESLGL